ncbi:hypothetical protein ERJ70_15790 [Sediminibacillus dalangtanensis]|uniref:Sporulation lipoprotein YhcN/YlaJ (Spore_YhcN_YlaJ) n=1 Tax=Sediminibacillus dalangtanensis TaxID=2729421 RepID=A0ABX7VUJ4_9BACI|nr:hypothetical protein [Sediminibacillus dalangtanensis]QTN00628.1 hypothetical protein ERJ70_15790 [Sediminibacillus dalangtanensis]
MKKIARLLILMNMLFLMTSCSNPAQPDSLSQEAEGNPVEFDYKGQHFTIVNLFDEMEGYVKAAKQQPENLDSLYKKHVLEPLRSMAFGEGNGYDRLRFQAPTDIEATEKALHTLIGQQEEISNIIRETLKKSADELPGGEKTVYIIPANTDFPDIYKVVDNVSGMVWQENFI